MINFKLEDSVEDSLVMAYDELKELKNNIFIDVVLSFRAAMPYRFKPLNEIYIKLLL